jgi:hypothetical protein
MNDTHEQLIQAFIKYFEANQKWETKQTHPSGIAARNHLLEIRALAKQRRVEIGEIRKNKPKLKSPKYKQSLLDQAKDDEA